MEDPEANILVAVAIAVLAIFVQIENHMGSFSALAGCRPMTTWRNSSAGARGPALNLACEAVLLEHATGKV